MLAARTEVVFHPKALAVLRTFPQTARRELGKLIFDLQEGTTLGPPEGDAR